MNRILYHPNKSSESQIDFTVFSQEEYRFGEIVICTDYDNPGLFVFTRNNKGQTKIQKINSVENIFIDNNLSSGATGDIQSGDSIYVAISKIKNTINEIISNNNSNDTLVKNIILTLGIKEDGTFDFWSELPGLQHVKNAKSFKEVIEQLDAAINSVSGDLGDYLDKEEGGYKDVIKKIIADALKGLNVDFNAEDGSVITGLKQTDGKVSATTKKLSVEKDDSGLVYTFKIGDTEFGEINIPKDQFLSEAKFIESATYEDLGEASAAGQVIEIGKPYLKFEWILGEEKKPTFVDVSALVDIYTAKDIEFSESFTGDTETNITDKDSVEDAIKKIVEKIHEIVKEIGDVKVDSSGGTIIIEKTEDGGTKIDVNIDNDTIVKSDLVSKQGQLSVSLGIDTKTFEDGGVKAEHVFKTESGTEYGRINEMRTILSGDGATFVDVKHERVSAGEGLGNTDKDTVSLYIADNIGAVNGPSKDNQNGITTAWAVKQYVTMGYYDGDQLYVGNDDLSPWDTWKGLVQFAGGSQFAGTEEGAGMSYDTLHQALLRLNTNFYRIAVALGFNYDGQYCHSYIQSRYAGGRYYSGATSVMGEVTGAGPGNYDTSKAAIQLLDDNIVMEWANHNDETDGYDKKAIRARETGADATANYAFAIGYDTKAAGEASYAEGIETHADGKGSHAEGNGTTASGENSHAEGSGSSTDAAANSAHAEGQNTVASGIASHAEGATTTASGVNSHAEGNGTKAEKESAHAEGKETTASGEISHAEGQNSVASGPVSHAEGSTTQALGSISHAEGWNTIASGACSHAEGGNTNASGQYSHAEGESTVASGMTAHAEGSGTTANGKYSHAEGFSTTAESDCAHAEGNGTTASGPQAHAEGNETIASGANSYAGGNGSTASGTNSHAEGFQTEAIGHNSHAEGSGTSATTVNSHAEGNTTLASNTNAHAEGFQTTASGANSHSEGANTKAENESAHAEGNGTTASGLHSHAEGTNTNAEGDHSHAEGWNTTASGACSHAEGYETRATGTESHAEGHDTEASGDNAHAEGGSTSATAHDAHAEGHQTTAEGYASHAEGSGTTASGDYSHAGGLGTVATNAAETAIGKYNESNEETIYSVGIGTSDDDRRNVIEYTTEGNAYGDAILTTSGAVFSQTTIGKLPDAYAVSQMLKSLDYDDTAVKNQYVSEVDQEDGMISVKREGLPVTSISSTGDTYVSITTTTTQNDGSLKNSDYKLTVEADVADTKAAINGVTMGDPKLAGAYGVREWFESLDSSSATTNNGYFMTGITINDGYITSIGQNHITSAETKFVINEGTASEMEQTVIYNMTTGGTNGHSITINKTNRVANATHSDAAGQTDKKLTIDYGNTGSTDTSFNGSADVTIRVPNDTSQLSNGARFVTSVESTTYKISVVSSAPSSPASDTIYILV